MGLAVKRLLSGIACTIVPLVTVSAQSAEADAGPVPTALTAGSGIKPESLRVGRADPNLLNFDRGFDRNCTGSLARLKFSNLGALCDYLAAEGLRLTAGMPLMGRGLERSGMIVGRMVRPRGTGDSADVGVSAGVYESFASADPYLGIGFGNARPKSGFGFYVDAGASLGRGDTVLPAGPGIAAAAGQGGVDAEQAKGQDRFSPSRLYPVIKLGVSYTY
jgi:hypothetical protein